MPLHRVLTYFALAVVALAVLAAVLEAAGHGAQLGVAIAALVLLVASYARIGVIVLRAAGDEDARERVRRLRVSSHIPFMFGAPYVVAAAHPWGMASLAVGFGAMIVCHVVFLHWTIIVGFVMSRRRRAAP